MVVSAGDRRNERRAKGTRLASIRVSTLPPYVHPSTMASAGRWTVVKRPYPAPGMSDGRTERGASAAKRRGAGEVRGAETQGADGDDAVNWRVARARTGHENRVLRGGTRREVEVRRRLIASELRADAHTPARTRVRACEAPGCPRQHSYSFAVKFIILHRPRSWYHPPGALSQPRTLRDAASVFSAGERRDRRNLR